MIHILVFLEWTFMSFYKKLDLEFPKEEDVKIEWEPNKELPEKKP